MKIPVFSYFQKDCSIEALYGAIVAQARAESFYRDFGVPDTIEGRFELIVLHLALALERFGVNPRLRAAGQRVFDLFCQDMDDHMREMGVGDLTVPKKMRRVADAFYGRHAAYRAALGDAAILPAVLARNVYGTASAPHAARLAAYVHETVNNLERQDDSVLAAGQVAWPEPDAISVSSGTGEG